MTIKRGIMDERERNELRRMMQEEQYEGELRDRMREIGKANFEAALHLRSMYDAYLRAGFSEQQAFTICIRYVEIVFWSNVKTPPPKDGKIF